MLPTAQLAPSLLDRSVGEILRLTSADQSRNHLSALPEVLSAPVSRVLRSRETRLRGGCNGHCSVRGDVCSAERSLASCRANRSCCLHPRWSCELDFRRYSEGWTGLWCHRRDGP